MIDQALLEILTGNEGEDLRQRLSTYFGRELDLESALSGKKVICCSKKGVEGVIALFANPNRPLPNQPQWSVGTGGAYQLESFIDNLE